jgi:Sigma-70, region 4
MIATPDKRADGSQHGGRRSRSHRVRRFVRLTVVDAGAEPPRPRQRGDCADVARPCPFVRCKYHLYLDVHPRTGAIKLNFPELEPWQLAESCALDVAERGGATLDAVGQAMNLTRERIRQLEVEGVQKLKVVCPSPDEPAARPRIAHGNGSDASCDLARTTSSAG